MDTKNNFETVIDLLTEIKNILYASHRTNLIYDGVNKSLIDVSDEFAKAFAKSEKHFL